MEKSIKFLLGLLPWRSVLNLIIDVLRNLAKKTETPVDDDAVDAIAALLDQFKPERKKKSKAF